LKVYRHVISVGINHHCEAEPIETADSYTSLRDDSNWYCSSIYTVNIAEVPNIYPLQTLTSLWLESARR
jgi:hypothetical protein